MNNRYIYTILAVVSLFSQISCRQTEVEEYGIDTDRIEAGPGGGVTRVNVSVAGNWTVEMSTEAQKWINVSPSSGVGSAVCEVRLDSAYAFEPREAVIRFAGDAGVDGQTVSVSQAGYERILSVSGAENGISVPNYAESGKRYFDVEVTANEYFTVEIPENASGWLTCGDYDLDLSWGARPRNVKIRFDWEGNIEEHDREAVIGFVTESGRVDMKVSQEQAPVITDDAKGDSLALVLIENKLGVSLKWNHDEQIQYWADVVQWKKSDPECIENPEMEGRVRSVRFSQFSFDFEKDGFPAEFGKLKYLERLSLFSNGNKFLRKGSDLGGIAELRNLKYLELYSVGLTDLPQSLPNLASLETLSLGSNNFTRLPSVLTPGNFPNLRYLSLAANGRSAIEDPASLRLSYPDLEDWGGFALEEDIWRLLEWDNLRQLILSNNMIRGSFPTDRELLDRGFETYSDADIAERGDTLALAADILKKTPKVLPDCVDFRIGLNYLYSGGSSDNDGDYTNGEMGIPAWILYHPHFMSWGPDISLFSQKEESVGLGTSWEESSGKYRSGFLWIPPSYQYYWDIYPRLK